LLFFIKETEMMTQKAKLREAFFNGAQLTSKQIRAQFKIASPTKVVSQLRLEDGIAIYSNKHTDTKGRVKNKFRMGNPRRAIVAAGYRALALGLV
jgi:hypothetical protein